MKKGTKKPTTKKKVVKKKVVKKNNTGLMVLPQPKKTRLKDLDIPTEAVLGFGYDMKEKEFMIQYKDQKLVMPRSKLKPLFTTLITAIKFLGGKNELVDSYDNPVDADRFVDISLEGMVKIDEEIWKGK